MGLWKRQIGETEQGSAVRVNHYSDICLTSVKVSAGFSLDEPYCLMRRYDPHLMAASPEIQYQFFGDEIKNIDEILKNGTQVTRPSDPRWRAKTVSAIPTMYILFYIMFSR